MMQNACLKCNKYGHWSNQNLRDGSLPPGTKSYFKAGYYNENVRSKNQHNLRNKAVSSEKPKVVTFKNSSMKKGKNI